MISLGLVENLIVSVPIIVLVFACAGIVWSVMKKRIYLIGFIFLLAGAGIHYWGVYVGRWEGMGISLFYGGGTILLGLLTLLLILVYSKMTAAKQTNK